METKKLLNKKITQWLLLGAMLVGCSASIVASNPCIHGNFDGSWKDWNLSSGKVTISLSANTSYEFGIKNNNGDWKSNNGTMTRSNCTSWTFESNKNNAWITADIAGDYVFNVTNTSGDPVLSVTYPDPEYYVTGNAPGTWGTWYKMTKGSNANEYYYDMPNTGEFKFSDNQNYNDNWYKTFGNTGTVTGVTLKNGPADNGANCNLSNTASGYTTPIRFWINVSTKYIWATATEVTCTTPTATQYPMTNATKTYGSVSAPTITPASGAGTVKKTYYTGINGTSYNKSETLPTNAGTYKVTVDVNAGSTYCAKDGIDLTGNFVINKANQSALTFNGSTQCVDTEVTLSASGGSSGQTITYTKKSGTGTVSNGKVTTSTAGDVVVTATRPGGTNYNDVTADATFTFTAKPTAYNVSGTASICTGSSTNVTLANSQSGYTYKLYKGGSATSTTKAGTGSALNFSVSEAGTYTVKGYVTGNEGCTADMTGSAVITVNQNMALTSISLNSASECIGGTSTITPNGLNLGGNGSISYTSSDPSIASVSGTTITANAAGTVTITGTVSGGCGSSVSKTESFTVNASNAIGSVTFDNSTIKKNATTTAHANDVVTSGAAGSWSSDNTSVATVNASTGVVTGKSVGEANIIYTLPGGCNDTSKGAVNSKSAKISVISDCDAPTTGTIGGTLAVCAGSGTTLTLTGYEATNTSLQWYKDDAVIIGATSDSYETGNLNATATYKVRVTRTNVDNCYADATAVTVTVTQIPTIATHTDGSRCGAGTVELQATASAGDVKWYSASTGGTDLKTGTSYTTPSISTTTTYYVDATQNGCTTAERTAVTATVKAVPSIGSISKSADECGAGNITFQANTVTSDATVTWYENSAALAPTGTVYTFTDVPAGTSHTVTAKATLNGCESAETSPVTGTRKAVPTLNIGLTSAAITDSHANSTYGWEAATFTATSSTDGATVTGGITQTTWETAGKDGIINGNTAKGHVGDAFTGSYTATGTNGCTTSDSKIVTVIKAEEVCN